MEAFRARIFVYFLDRILVFFFSYFEIFCSTEKDFPLNVTTFSLSLTLIMTFTEASTFRMNFHEIKRNYVLKKSDSDFYLAEIDCHAVCIA